MRSPTLKVGVMACCLVLAIGCKQAAQEAIRAVAVSPVVAPVIKPPGEEQEKRFVDALMSAAQHGNAPAFNDLIHWDALARRAARDLHAPTAILDGIVKGAREGCVSTGVCMTLASTGQGKATLRHLGPLVIAGERWTTFRRLPTEGGFDHVSFLLSVDDKGVAHAIDVLVLSLGETTSNTLRRGLLPMLALDEEHVVRRMQGTESAFAKHGAEIGKAQQLAANGQAAEALAVLNKLPATLRNDRFIMGQRATITRMTGDEQAYLNAIDELLARHPSEPIALLNSLDGFALRHRYTDALTAISRIEAMIAPDPYVDVLRSNLQASANLTADAMASAKRAIAREPELEAAHWALVAATLKKPDYAETSQALLAIHKQFHFPINLDGVPDYAGFVASSEYPKLQAALAAQ